MYSLGFAGRCPPAGWRQATQPLTSTLFDPANFSDFGIISPFYIGPMSRYTRFMVHLSESGRKRATRAVTAWHMGKKTASQRHLTESSTFGEITAIRWTYFCATQ